MNREIKFRAWDTQINKMVNPLKLDFFTNSGCTNNKPSHLEVELTTCDFKGVTDTNNYDDISDRFILMQYTGLNDKHNNPIYEGDIVNQEKWVSVGKYEPSIGVVTYVGIKFTSVCVGNWAGAHADLNGNATVIGNIFQNPELLSH